MFTLADFRRLLDQFQAAAKRRAAAEQQLAAHFGGEDAEANALRAKLAETQQRASDSTRELREEREAVDAALEAQHRDRLATIDAAERSRVARAVSQYDDDLERLHRDFEDKKWVVGSLLDESADDSPQRRLDKLVLAYDRTEQTMIAAEADLEERLSVAAKSLGVAYQTPAVGTLVNESPEDLAEQHQQFADEASGALDVFDKRVVSKLLGGWGTLGVFLIAFAIPAAILWTLVNPLDHGISREDFPLYVLGGAAVLAALVTLAVWGITRSRRRQPFSTAIASHREAITRRESWSRKTAARREKEIAKLEKEIESVESRRASKEEQIAKRKREQEAELERSRDGEIEAASRERIAARQQAEQDFEAAKSEIAAEHERRAAETGNAHRIAMIDAQESVDDYDRQRSTEISELESRMTRGWSKALTALDEAVSDVRVAAVATSWDQLADPNWRPADGLPRGLRIGDFTVPLAEMPAARSEREALRLPSESIKLPAVLPFPSVPSAVFRGRGQAFRDAGVHALQVAMLRAFTQIPPGKVRCTLIDPVGLGEAFAGFMHLADVDDRMVSGRVWTESAQIESQLADLTEHMENVLQTYLRGDFNSIEEYNIKAGEVAEPYRFLVIAGFPHRFTEVAWRRLVSIAQSGPRCGVFLLLTHDDSQQLPLNADAADLLAHAELFTWDEDCFRPGEPPRAAIETSLISENDLTDDEDTKQPATPATPPPLPVVRRLALTIDTPPEAAVFTQIVRNVADRSRDAGRVEVSFGRIAPDDLWTFSTKSGLDIPLGRAGATKLQHALFGRGTAQHMLVAGKTGSGKSTFLHALVTCAAMRYSPDEIRFFLIDFKKGVEFKAYAGAKGGPPLPHADVIAIESEREFGVSALRRLDGILDERGERFRAAGVQDVASFRDARPDEPMPRIMLLIDEFQEFFVEDDKLGQEATLLLDRLVRQGRAFGVHCVLGSQTLGGAYGLPRTTLGQIGIRVALQCSEADAYLILAEGNSAARLLGRPGEAIYNDAGGMTEGNQPFQVAWLPDEQRADILARISEHGRAVGRTDPAPMIFEGDKAARLEANERLRDVAAGNTPRDPRRIELGDAVEIKPATAIELKRQAGRNLLVCGPAVDLARGVLVSAAIQSARLDPSRRTIVLRDPDETDGVWDALRSERGWQLAAPHEAADVMAELDAELSGREGAVAREASPIVVIVDGAAAFRNLARPEDDYGFGASRGSGSAGGLSNPLAAFAGGDEAEAPPPPKPARQPGAVFADLLSTGPERGIHVIVWGDGFTAIDRLIGRRGLKEFAVRVLTQLNGNDSSQLIDSPAASRLSGNRALLYRDDTGAIEKFRPYAVPTPESLASLTPSAAEPEEMPPIEEPPSEPSLDDFLVV